MSKQFFVYLLANKPQGILYIGVTSDLARRIWEHKQAVVAGFTKRYGVKRLVYYEVHASPIEAITREKQMKKWNRTWKVQLIEKSNPDWDALYEKVVL
ncbi:MAG: GIY-YIG nuclease family protein [Acidobacteriota bacterium]